MRRRIDLMDNWTFIKKGVSAMVNLPHTWNNIDGQDGGNDYYRGTCTYEKEVIKPDYNPESELVFLEFDGVNASAGVFVNDEFVVGHHGGYSTFRCNITEYLKDNNKIKVEVDNSKNKIVYPQIADFTFYGGIYRNVSLLITDRTHFELEKWGTPGIKVTAVPEASGKAKVTVETQVSFARRDMAEEKNISLEVIIQKSGEDLEINNASWEKTEQLLSKQKNPLQESEQEEVLATSNVFEIDKPHLWNGLEDPYLYKAQCRLYRDDILIDEVSCNFGIRTIEFDKNKGFLLNGKSYPLRGVSRHQDRKAVGNAITTEMMLEDMELIKEMGANCIRLAHYQHSQYFYDLCDREGMVVWAEIPYISSYMKEGDENTHNQMRELITQNYNHPSIVTWGLSNEITIFFKNSRGNNIKNHISLNELVHKMDPYRPTTMACFALCSPFHPVTRIPDIIGWNLYLGWYIPGLILNDAFMWFYHTFFKLPLAYSEYGAEGMPNLHSEKPRRGDHTEEYQAKYHEYMLKCFDRHQYLWGTFVWNMFDFAADARNQGGEPGMNHKGMVTFDRKIKKDSFYLYKAWWSKEDFVHITGKRFVYRNKRNIDIKVYSNRQEVSLYIDDKLYASEKGEKIFVFKNVPISEKTRVRAVSEGVEDRAEFCYTEDVHDEYKLKKDKNKAAANWV